MDLEACRTLVPVAGLQWHRASEGLRPGAHRCAAPRAQPLPHGNFGGEVAQLRERLGALGALGSAYVLGDALNGLQWHVFVADAGAAAGAPPPPPVYTLEICMTHLCPAKVRGAAARRGSLPACAAAA